MSDFTLHTLGCGSAKPSVHHNPSCSVLDHRGNLFMIDCGEGAQKVFQSQHLKFSRLRHVFLTHLHGDHVFGLPGLVGTLALSGIEGQLTIHTFKEGIEILKKIFDYFERDLPLKIDFNEIGFADEEILNTKSLKVRTVKLKHRVSAVGFVFEETEKERHIIRDMIDFHKVPVSKIRDIKQGADFVKDDGTIIPNRLLTTDPSPSKSYAHISDTMYMPGLAKKVEGVDLLFHETTYLSDLEKTARERGHSTAAQAAMVARDAHVGRLLTGHYSSRYKDDTAFLKEAQQIFPNTILNREGLKIEI